MSILDLLDWGRGAKLLPRCEALGDVIEALKRKKPGGACTVGGPCEAYEPHEPVKREERESGRD